MPSYIQLILPYLLIAVVIGLSLALFVLVKADVRRYGSEWEREREGLLEHQRELKTQIVALETAMREQEQRAESMTAVPVSSAVRPGMNLQRRAQILRLAKRGDNPQQIASTVGMPQNEVELLLKLHAQQSAAVS
ncbi:MAG: hypothetical protein IT168_04275 [Bryobacterales bacterium]|nr:hypothetical protein [Bryobacterales bacterium]